MLLNKEQVLQAPVAGSDKSERCGVRAGKAGNKW
jgi:hypothetical protein